MAAKQSTEYPPPASLLFFKDESDKPMDLLCTLRPTVFKTLDDGGAKKDRESIQDGFDLPASVSPSGCAYPKHLFVYFPSHSKTTRNKTELNAQTTPRTWLSTVMFKVGAACVCVERQPNPTPKSFL